MAGITPTVFKRNHNKSFVHTYYFLLVVSGVYWDHADLELPISVALNTVEGFVALTPKVKLMEKRDLEFGKNERA